MALVVVVAQQGPTQVEEMMTMEVMAVLPLVIHAAREAAKDAVERAARSSCSPGARPSCRVVRRFSVPP